GSSTSKRRSIPKAGPMRVAAMRPRRLASNSTPRMIMRRMITRIMLMMTTITNMMSIAATTIITITTTPMLMTTNDRAPVDDRSVMGDGEAAALYRLMTWLSPAFPVGGFSYSSGIEWAVEAGDIAGAATL